MQTNKLLLLHTVRMNTKANELNKENQVHTSNVDVNKKFVVKSNLFCTLLHLEDLKNYFKKKTISLHIMLLIDYLAVQRNAK